MALRRDYDTPWKEALALYLPSFFQFFFPSIENKLDWIRGFKLLDKELRKLERDSAGGNREADTLVEVYSKSGKVTWALVHIEVQSQTDSRFLERMFTYYARIYDHYREPVCSLAVLGDDQKNWRPSQFQQKLWGAELCFRFPTVKLLDYQDKLSELESSNNPFAILVASTLHARQTQDDPVARRVAKFRLVRGLFERGLAKTQVRAFFRLVDWILTLPADEQEIFDQTLQEYERKTNMPFITSIERKGLKKGHLLGLRNSLATVLRTRFGPPSQELLQQIEHVQDESKLTTLTEFAVVAVDSESFERELAQHLNEAREG